MASETEHESDCCTRCFSLIGIIEENAVRLDSLLADRGLRDNAVPVFINGNVTGKGETALNAGMRGTKGSSCDGGHRAICSVRWRGGDLREPRSVRYASHDIGGSSVAWSQGFTRPATEFRTPLTRRLRLSMAANRSLSTETLGFPAASGAGICWTIEREAARTKGSGLRSSQAS